MTQHRTRLRGLMSPLVKPWQLVSQLNHHAIDPVHGLTAEQTDNMTQKEIEEHCASWKLENTWNLTREVSDRIHDEPGPGKHDFLISVPSYPREKQIIQFLAKYLVQWRKASTDKREKMCGNAMCLKLQKLKEDHVRRGHYYLEYLKFAREPTVNRVKRKGGQLVSLQIGSLFLILVIQQPYHAGIFHPMWPVWVMKSIDNF